MIRLLMVTSEESHWKGVATRLKGVALEVSRSANVNEDCHALVFTGRQPIDENAVKRALHAGKQVLFAAEPTWSRAEWELMFEAARQGGVQLAVVNPERHRPSRQLIKQLIPDKLGQVGLIRLHRWEPVSGPTNAPVLPGPLLRDLDIALWMGGWFPETVFAIEQRLEEPSAACGRCLQIHLGSPGGGMALIDYNGRLPDGDGYQALSVIGSTGAAYADEHRNMQLAFRGGRPQAIQTSEGIKQDVDLVQSFADGLCSGHDLTQTVSAWRNVLDVAEAVQQSLATRQAIRLEGR